MSKARFAVGMPPPRANRHDTPVTAGPALTGNTGSGR